MLFGARIEPLAVLVSILTVPPALVRSCGSFNPWLAVRFVFVSTIGVTMAPIEPMLGAVMHNFVPSLSLAVLLHDSFFGASVTVVVGLATVRASRSLCGTGGNG